MFQNIVLGQYVPGKAFAYLLDPRTKIVLTLLFVIALFATASLESYIIMFVWLTLAIIASKVSISLLLRGLRGFIIIVIFTSLISLFFTEGQHLFSWYFITITEEGLSLAIVAFVRILLLLSGTILLTYTTSPQQLTNAINYLLKPFKRIGMPAHEWALIISIALRFLPVMLAEGNRIVNAQKARGADFGSKNPFVKVKALIPIIVPLFNSAWQRVNELSLAMECRCFSPDARRTTLRGLKMATRDYGCIIFAIIALLAVFFTN